MNDPEDNVWLVIRVQAASVADASKILNRIASHEDLTVDGPNMGIYDLYTDSRTSPAWVGTAQTIMGPNADTPFDDAKDEASA